MAMIYITIKLKFHSFSVLNKVLALSSFLLIFNFTQWSVATAKFIIFLFVSLSRKYLLYGIGHMFQISK